MKGRRVIQNADDVTRLITFLGDFPMPYTVTLAQGKGRTLSQNALLHKWFGEVAAQKGDETMTGIKADCHHKYGLAIRLRDDGFAWMWKQTGALMNYEQQRKFLVSGILKISSEMSEPELREYMTAMGRDYRQEGYTLTDPEMMKYGDTI